jgi:hypothetical protein
MGNMKQISEMEEKPFMSSLFIYLSRSLLNKGLGAEGVAPPLFFPADP